VDLFEILPLPSDTYADLPAMVLSSSSMHHDTPNRCPRRISDEDDFEVGRTHASGNKPVTRRQLAGRPSIGVVIAETPGKVVSSLYTWTTAAAAAADVNTITIMTMIYKLTDCSTARTPEGQIHARIMIMFPLTLCTER